MSKSIPQKNPSRKPLKPGEIELKRVKNDSVDPTGDGDSGFLELPVVSAPVVVKCTREAPRLASREASLRGNV